MPERPARAEAQAKLPSFIVVGVTQGGGLLNSLGNGLGKMISEKGPFVARLRAASGGLDKLAHDSDAHVAMSVSVESFQSSRGLEHYSGTPLKKIRLVASGPNLIAGFLVKKDASFSAITDLKGKKVPGEYPSTRPLYFDGVALLAAAGMKWSDLSITPVADIGEGVQVFVQGRTDATIISVGAPFVREADAQLKGVRFIGLPTGPEVAKRMWEAIPGYYPLPLKAGFSAGVDRDMVLAAKDIYVNSGSGTDPAVVYEVTKAMWNHMATLHDVHPLFRTWTQTAMLKASVTIPYHDGAVRFYKEVGKWTPEHEAAQKALLEAVGK